MKVTDIIQEDLRAWFGKGKKGLIFGIWNSHTSIGNILGSLLAGKRNISQYLEHSSLLLFLPGVYVEENWGLSFIVPGLIISVVGILFYFVLVPNPECVGLDGEVQVEERRRLEVSNRTLSQM